ncbi:3,4-dihydroxy-2-butanone-4-phosphate synthase [Rhodococcus sp. NCIMB 12038]|uniref:3,4-dihydroxy-2-butanone-4-phosphate synthase n=1 Tax=Rhodococcus sp. NCIMB 12038 TaxID=933800 RepID=UPI000B3CD073|nr:3,4-dihydroxy-2-butanone-4-phosphate synthase [Rhodococcus sp. NCIMB 12038]OUS91382.1 hypothetical protein CA951_33555 [Rhodococcus sp. NCIMB 12038]
MSATLPPQTLARLHNNLARSVWALDHIHYACTVLSNAQPVVLIDDRPGRDEGYIVYAAAHANPLLMALTIRHTSGFVCVAVDGETCDRLGLPPMWWPDHDGRPHLTVTVDAAVGVGTGISATDRAHTATVLANPDATSADLTRPGHLVPVRAQEALAADSLGIPEAALDLVQTSGHGSAAVFSTVVGVADATTNAGRGELVEFALEHRMPIVTLTDVRISRIHRDGHCARAESVSLPDAPSSDIEALACTSCVDEQAHPVLFPTAAAPANRLDVLTRMRDDLLRLKAGAITRSRPARALVDLDCHYEAASPSPETTIAGL